MLGEDELAQIQNVEKGSEGRMRTQTLDITHPVSDGGSGLEKAIEGLCGQGRGIGKQ